MLHNFEVASSFPDLPAGTMTAQKVTFSKSDLHPLFFRFRNGRVVVSENLLQSVGRNVDIRRGLHVYFLVGQSQAAFDPLEQRGVSGELRLNTTVRLEASYLDVEGETIVPVEALQELPVEAI